MNSVSATPDCRSTADLAVDREAAAWRTQREAGRRARPLRTEKAMFVSTIHEVSDPAAFWGGQLDLPHGTELLVVMPSDDGSRGVCVFKSDSIDTVKDLVDGATSAVSKNAFYAIDEGHGQGLP